MQPVRTDRQIRRPDDDAIIGFALCDNLKTRNDFPAQRKRGSVAQFGSHGSARSEPPPPARETGTASVGRASRMIFSASASVTWR